MHVGYDTSMRSRTLLLALVLAVGSLALPLAAHAAIPFFGPVIPPQSITGVLGSDTCAAGFGMLIMVINNIISLLLTVAILFVAPIMIAWSGFLFVVNPVNPSKKEEAKGILLHTVVGIVIALCGWLIVDAIMAVLYKPDTPVNGGTLGVWSQLITSGALGPCIPLAGSLSQATQQNTAGVSTGGLTLPPTQQVGTACDPAAVLAAAAAGNPSYTLTTVEANTFACIAGPESSCGKKLINFNFGKGSTAVGAFQVLLQSNASCYENTSCYAAAGVMGPLNCASGFTGGNPIQGSKVAQDCVNAASNFNCSAASAACLLRRNHNSFSPWQQDVNSAVQSGCIKNAGT